MLCIAVVLYTWIAYPLLLGVLRLCRGRGSHFKSQSGDPFVSIIVPVHNEQEKIARKLRDCLELLYPRDGLEILVASDGSTDRTEEIVRQFLAADSRIRWIEIEHRVGKSDVQNLAAAQALGEVLLFTDADTVLPPGVLRTMMDDLADPTVGLVTATVNFGHPSDAVEKGQGLYWRYELFMRALESDLGILATGSGQALAVRRELFRPLPACYGDDCITPLDVRLQGYKVIQNRKAKVFDTMPHSIEGELRARIRMTARNWTGMLARPAILNPLRFPLTAPGLADPVFPGGRSSVERLACCGRPRRSFLVAAGKLLPFRICRLGAKPKAAAGMVLRLSVFVLPGQCRVHAGNAEGLSKPEDCGVLKLDVPAHCT
jgi:GT2 family glycosyltransferase